MTSRGLTAESVALYGGFLLNGAVSVLLGPVIPELRVVWGVAPAAAASLFVAQFAASSLGAVASSFHLRLSLFLGYGAIAAGVALLATGEWSLARIAMGTVGVGLGLTIPATNLVVSHRNPGRRGAALATLNLTWGVGAMACPLVFAALRGRVPATAALWGLAAAAAITSLATAFAAADAAPSPASQESAVRPRFGFLLLIAAMLFLYVGSESTMGGWLVELADQLGGEKTAVSMLIGSCFWGAILAGRASASVLLRRISEPALYTASLALALAGTSTVLLAETRAGVAVGAIAAGAGMAPLFPLTISILTARTASSGSRGTGWVFACGGFGGALLPWLTGQATGGADPSRGFVVPVAGMALLAILYALHRRVPD